MKCSAKQESALKHLQTLQAQHAPQLPKQRGKPTHLADYLEQVQLRKLTRQERAAAAQWIRRGINGTVG